ncbi:hypothetical protein CBR_g26415 [Chara braunii]|uniref:CCHC-type domain-containing protein n=1 Tax=Chara braunii TaxID=69332 RepID=A0A388L7W6_CHABU|nr:hypothetical protein CBR_g26415 [Chara braunii]|eukprot:GBG78387.1 hypothetical protein CBR_g26415 [Chara braunii]
MMDAQTKLSMSLDDLAASGGRRMQNGVVARRALRRPAPYGIATAFRGASGAAVRPRGPGRLPAELCNNCKRPGHFARECPNQVVCNNCGLSGHLASACTNEPVCRNCKQQGHIAGQCRNEAVCNICGRAGHIARGCLAMDHRDSYGVPRSHLCNNCFKAGHIAVDCPNETACNNCRMPGHLARDCTDSPVCNVCSERGHIARECPRNMTQPMLYRGGMPGGGAVGSFLGNMGPVPPPDVVCHNCKVIGHFAKDCTQLTVCNNCGGRGHLAIECPSELSVRSRRMR